MIRRLRTTLDGRGAASAASRPSGRSALVWIVLLALVALTAAGVSRVKVETGVESFLPSSDPSVQRYTELARSFGGDPIVVLLRAPQAPGLLDRDVLPHVLGLEGQLSQLPDVASVYGPATTLNQLASQSQKLLAELTGRRDGLQRAAAITAQQRGEDPGRCRERRRRGVRRPVRPADRAGPAGGAADPAQPALHRPLDHGFGR